MFFLYQNLSLLDRCQQHCGMSIEVYRHVVVKKRSACRLTVSMQYSVNRNEAAL